MSVQIQSMAIECAREIAAPNMDRVTTDDWLQFANRIARELCVRWKVYEIVSIGDLVTDERYPYPADLVRLRRVHWTPTPDDLTTFRKLGERFEDEMDALTDYQYRTGDPTGYWARSGFFQLDSIPSAVLEGALKIEYWGVAPDATDYLFGLWPLPDFTRNHAQDGMKVLAKWKLRHYTEAERDWQRWLDGAYFTAERMEDRSEDRRTAFRPRALNDMFGDAV